VLANVAKICETTREAVALNSPNIGGAQYLLKNISSQFWTDCFNRCCEMKTYLEDINRNFFPGNTFQEKEDKGIQSFCTDMWTLLFSLIGEGKEIRAPKELDFAWSTDLKERANDCFIIHNAGVTSEAKIRIAFQKNEDGSNKWENHM